MNDAAIVTKGLTRTFDQHVFGDYSSWSAEGNPGSFLQLIISRRLSRGMHKQRVVAVDHVDLNVRQGTLVALLGPNGSGKTTLLKLMAGILTPSEGSILIQGHDLTSEPHLISRLVNYLPGIMGGGAWVEYSLTARRNLQFYADVFSLPKRKVDEALELAGLGKVADSRVGTFSTGMYGKLVLAAGLLRDAPIYLMDEPTMGLSREVVLDLRTYIKDRLCQELGSTVFYATHAIEEAQSMADVVVIMDKGRAIRQGSPNELIGSLSRDEIIEIEALNLDAKLVTCLRELDGVSKIVDAISEQASGKGILRIHVKEVRSVLPSIVETLVQAGAKIRFLAVEEPNLEDVFISLVGRSITGAAVRVEAERGAHEVAYRLLDS